MNATLLRTFVAICTAALGSTWAQESKLPPCPTNLSYWTECFGARDLGAALFVGEFKNNTPDGQGRAAAWSNGDKYVGAFKDGKREGYGTYTYANGDRYVGEFKNNKYDGIGRLTYADGWKRVGEYKDGKRQGVGIVYDPSGQVDGSGYYHNDQIARSHYVNPAQFEKIQPNSSRPSAPESTRLREPGVSEARAREQERLKAAELETEQKRTGEAQQRQRELEERTREKERLRNAELEAERKLREELEEKLRAAQQQRYAPAPIPRSLNAHALVIGNASYPGSGRLENPVNDSRAMSAKFRSLGFKVTEVENANRAKLVTALGQFSRTAAAADLSVLFYSGHGVQLLGTNYILPTDVDQSDLAQATIQGISLDNVIGQFLPGKTKLVFLDACRDNPLYQLAANRSFSKGLAPINVAEGTLIAYATKDGQVASDGGKGTKNSPFTVALLEHLSDPDDIAIVLRRVREKVKLATDGKQVPWDYGSLTGGALILSAIKLTEPSR